MEITGKKYWTYAAISSSLHFHSQPLLNKIFMNSLFLSMKEKFLGQFVLLMLS